MTPAGLEAIRARIVAHGQPGTKCEWCGEEIPPEGRTCDPFEDGGSATCERDPDDLCQEDRAALLDEVERLTGALATATAQFTDAREQLAAMERRNALGCVARFAAEARLIRWRDALGAAVKADRDAFIAPVLAILNDEEPGS